MIYICNDIASFIIYQKRIDFKEISSMRFCSLTLGCKVNQFDTHAIEGILTSRGHILVGPGDGCDVCIINTCAVTAESLRKSRQAVRKMKKAEPEALIVVCGCLSQLDPSTAVSLGADIVGGSGERSALAQEIERLSDKAAPRIVLDDPENRRFFEELPPGQAAGRTRALLKIQDGCDNFCAFCVVPYARGRSRSLPVERAVSFARSLDSQGFREIVITGIEISSYGKDLDGKPTLTEVVREISFSAPRARLRLGSLDPGAVTESFCDELCLLPNLCGHFHLSLQSGCDDTLRRMGRVYKTDSVRMAVSMLRQRFPNCGITADLITGFPGETETEFMSTLNFVEEMAFSNMHIFPFSPRPGTLANDMPGQTEKSVRRERARLATVAAGRMAGTFRFSQIGKTTGVLFERKRGGCWTGLSENYIEVTVKNGGARNSVEKVKITGVDDGVVWGNLE